ncbi:Lsr2 family protein [Rhodococcus sp. IEGM 1379]|uniref:histone-like nucleoid-structuring protein Lsr2 n=1 Tax=Rhodococcus sp. IEGM 1379 TaxID=3047086 RepID=UPI0024B80FD6|nr:Lsr2 family protein [Rhodococcus sp. IEGM 1379]MDI9919170.1 Lsr2 family protein [Rhodococcus sp. IEGM 1379]
MAKRVVVTLVDDLDKGSPADETVEFSIDGVGYEIDLTSAHAAELRNALSSWISHARKSDARKGVNGATSTYRPISERDESANIREWAKAAGYVMAPRGRIAIEVRKAYENAI